jgi:hypothetical protein
MVATLLAVALLAPSQPQAAEFFPLVPGTKWHYEEIGTAGAVLYVDHVGTPEEVDGKLAVPVSAFQGNRKLDTTYYRADGEAVLIVGYQPDKPLQVPRPILRVGSGRVRWNFVGDTPFYHDPVPLRMEGEANLRGTREVLGRKVDVLEVKLTAKVGGDAGTALDIRQTTLYGRGIGMIEMTEVGKVGKSSHRRTLKLVKFEPGEKETR